MLDHMQIRPMRPEDLDQIAEIDGTVESTEYLFVQRSGAGLERAWALQRRPLRQKLISPRRLAEDAAFMTRQIVTGADEGVALAGEHEGVIVAMLVARPCLARQVMEVIDVRVDYDYRRQGLGLAMLYQLVQLTREQGLRAISARVLANNFPAAQLLHKCGFALTGLDTHHDSNHDLVKEAVSLAWYLELE